MKSHKQAFAEKFSEQVAEGGVGKIYCPCREDPLSPAVGRGFVGMRETHLSFK